ncbi:Ethylene receptor 2 [Platanthera guangdongensis]|uniref:Ethylene receptor n=1 Tax=Platanthera guangdongensis TaxID=2320717 RepID=A0ABR2LS11_9ASPA
MLKALCHGLLFLLLMLSASAIEVGYPRCNCDIDSFLSAEGILQCQKVSDFLIAAAYFSIPLELLYFATCSNLFPFKWIVFQFGAFIVLCGLTHLLNVFTYEPHSFLLMLSLTISKLFTALVSFATAITLLTLIPQLLRVKVRENFLRIKARELNREVGMMKRKEEASWHVRMLTQEIRKSLDRHTILYTTLVELSKTLGLQNCAVWMPDEGRKVMNLTHELRQRRSMELYDHSIPIGDQDVVEVNESNGVRILRRDSMLALASGGGDPEQGSIAAIRMPMLKVSNFKGGTPEIVQASYAILVLVLPGDDSRIWSHHELEIIEVVADQVAVALSHAALLEESQLMRDKLAEQNRALLQEKKNALMASEARSTFQRVMCQGMRRPIHSIVGLLSMMQEENLSCEQRLIINSISKTTGVVSTLITDAMEISRINGERLTLEMRSFHLHSMIKEAASVARCLCDCKGFGFDIQFDNRVPDRVVGDEKRIFHAILHVMDKLLSGYDEGFVSFEVDCYSESQDSQDHEWITWKSNFPGVSVKFEIGIRAPETSDLSSPAPRALRLDAEGHDMDRGFIMCKKIVEMMHGDIWIVPNSRGLPRCIKLLLQFQLQPLGPNSDLGESSGNHHMPSIPNFKGLRVLLADDDDINRAVTRKLLEKLGCKVTSVASGIQCLGSLGASGTPYQLVILGLHMAVMDGFEVAARIRKMRSRSWPAIVALTASAEEHVWQRCLQAGMNGLIRKPAVLRSVGEELYRVLHDT